MRATLYLLFILPFLVSLEAHAGTVPLVAPIYNVVEQGPKNCQEAANMAGITPNEACETTVVRNNFLEPRGDIASTIYSGREDFGYVGTRNDCPDPTGLNCRGSGGNSHSARVDVRVKTQAEIDRLNELAFYAEQGRTIVSFLGPLVATYVREKRIALIVVAGTGVGYLALDDLATGLRKQAKDPPDFNYNEQLEYAPPEAEDFGYNESGNTFLNGFLSALVKAGQTASYIGTTAERVLAAHIDQNSEALLQQARAHEIFAENQSQDFHDLSVWFEEYSFFLQSQGIEDFVLSEEIDAATLEGLPEGITLFEYFLFLGNVYSIDGFSDPEIPSFEGAAPRDLAEVPLPPSAVLFSFALILLRSRRGKSSWVSCTKELSEAA